VTADLSFIGLVSLLPGLALLPRPGGRLLLLVKPQFELPAAQVEPGGVVRSAATREQAVAMVEAAAARSGLAQLGRAESHVLGPRGNREVFVLLARPPG
jgi:23S rRNA (cytidine1920-2'-O)/16S rRNA (cytidine1409-2'-O)-methyltransferase